MVKESAVEESVVKKESPKGRKISSLEMAMRCQMLGANLPEWCEEFLFSERKFRFDFAWPFKLVALEIEGGSWSGGRHITGKGFELDVEKYNLAALLGWTVIRATSKHINNGMALSWIECLLKRKRK